MLKELLRKKDFYVLFFLMGVFLFFFAAQDFFGVTGISRYVIDLGYSMAIFFSVLIAVVTAARQLPSEVSSGTIYPLMSKPISRQMIITAEFFGSFTASAACFTMFYVVFMYFYLASGVSGSYMLAIQGYVLGIFLMAMVVSLATFFANFLTLSANITFTIIVYAAILNFSSYMRNAYIFSTGPMSFINGITYYLLPHFEFYDIRTRIVHAWDALPATLLAAIAVYTFCYCCALLTLSGIMFRRRGF
jgi:ABC-type transport system involved in multi-copper enzyme maturation permease subunit